MRRPPVLFLISLALFAALMAAGMTLACHKPLWNDELYSQISSVQGISYADMLGGKISEGNNCPLFYAMQKILCGVVHYRLPAWKGGNVEDAYAQVLLRVNSMVSMSLAAVVIFYFFARLAGLMPGIYAALLFCASFVVWAYIAEARPYALWVLLTVLQTLALFHVLRSDEKSSRGLRGLAVVHWLLSLSSIFGTVQAVLACCVLCMRRGMRPLRQWTGVLLVPLVAGFFYYWHAPKYPFRVGDVTNLIVMNVSLERLLFLGVYVLFVLLYPPWRRQMPRSAQDHILVFFAGLLLMSVTVIFFYKLREMPGHQGFEIANRYFMNLAPVSALAAALAMARALESFRHDAWVRLNVHLAVGGFIIIEGLRAYTFLIGFYQW